MPKERKLPLCGLLPLLTMPATGVRQVRTITFCFLYSTIIPNPPLPVKGEIAFLSPYFFRAPGLHFSPPPPPARGRHTGRRPPRLRRGKRASPVSAALRAAGPAALSCGEQQPAEERGRQRSPCGMQGDAVVQKPQQRQRPQHAEYRVDGTDQAAEAE